MVKSNRIFLFVSVLFCNVYAHEEAVIIERKTKTPLIRAIKSSDVAQVNRLIREGADVQVRVGNRRKTALEYAIKRKSASIVQALLDAGADPDTVVILGMTGLQRYIPKISLQQNIKEVTMLQYAVLRNAPIEILDALIDAGADVNAHAPNKKCWTALNMADMLNNQEAVDLLKDYGAIEQCKP